MVARDVMFCPKYIENWLLFIETNEVGLFSFPYDVSYFIKEAEKKPTKR
jgi:hypothetical protein